MDNGSFGKQLKRYRELARLTQEQLAEKAGLTVKGVSALERGERQRPYPQTVRALATALHLSEEERDALEQAIPRPNIAPATPERVTLSPTIPLPLLPLIGREPDVAVCLRLMTGAGRLLTLTGPGGVGKTRLALALVAKSMERFVDGCVFVSLAPLSNPSLVLTAIADALGVREGGDQTISEALRTALAARHLLLVLDNFEHLLSAAPEIAGLLVACPNLTVLITSRAPLRIRGEQEYPVTPLPIPTLTHVPFVDDLKSVPAVQLFVERAQAVAPHFALTQTNATAIAAICRRLDGLPLALELAAARVKVLTPTMLLARLDSTLPLLVGGARDLPQRQQTMRQTIEWSYNLLSGAEKRLLCALSVFAGGWTFEAAEALSSPSPLSTAGGTSYRAVDEVVEGLTFLQDNSLILRLDVGDSEEEPRFGMLETIRAFALEQLEASGELEARRTAHATYYGALTDIARIELTRKTQAVWYKRLAQEYDNLRITFEWWDSHDQYDELAHAIWSIYRFFLIRGHLREAQQWVDAVLVVATNPRTRARMLLLRALYLEQRGESGQGLAALAEVLVSNGAGDAELHAGANTIAGWLSLQHGEAANAKQYFERGAALADKDNGRGWRGNALLGVGYATFSQGDAEQAWQRLREVETLLRAAGSWWDLGVTLEVQAALARLAGDISHATHLLYESLTISRNLEDEWAMLHALNGLAGVVAAQGKNEKAVELFGAIQALSDTTGIIGYMPHNEREQYDQQIETLHDQLGEERFNQAWNRGHVTPLDLVLNSILGESGR